MGKLFPASVKMLYRNKQSLFWALAFPIIFTVVFGLFDFEATPAVKIALVGDTTSPAYQAMDQALGQVKSFTVKPWASLDAAKAAIEGGLSSKNSTDIVISIPASTTGQAAITVYYSESNMQTNQFALSAIQQVADKMNLKLAGAQAVVSILPEPVSARHISYYDFILPGLVAMGVMNYSISGMAISLSRFREQRILKRILATPLAPVRFLSAQVLAHLLLALVQAMLILAVGIGMFGGHVYGSIPELLVLVTLANIIFLNIGFAIAGRASNPDAASGVANAVALPMMFLSGVFFQTSTLPDIMQKIVALLPLTPLIEAMRKISVDGAAITACGRQLAYLGIWVVVSFGLARLNFSFAERNA